MSARTEIFNTFLDVMNLMYKHNTQQNTQHNVLH